MVGTISGTVALAALLAPASPAMLGEWPGGEKRVTLVVERVPLDEALAKLAAEAGWSVVTPPLPWPVTIRAAAQPADEVLAGLLAARPELRATRKGGSSLITIAVAAPEPGRKRHGRPDRVQVGKDLTIEADEQVGNAIAVGGGLEVRGNVDGDAVAIGGNLRVRKGARVGGDTVAVGGKLEVEEGAAVSGQRVSVAGAGLVRELLARAPALSAWRTWRSRADDVGSGWTGRVIFYVLCFLVGLMFVGVAPRRTAVLGEGLRSGFARAWLVGLGSAALVGIAGTVLTVTLIGIPIALLLLMTVLLATMWGFAALAVGAGERIGVKSPVAALALGTTLLFLIGLIPVAGGLLLWIASFATFGVVLKTGLGTAPAPSGTVS